MQRVHAFWMKTDNPDAYDFLRWAKALLSDGGTLVFPINLVVSAPEHRPHAATEALPHGERPAGSILQQGTSAPMLTMVTCGLTNG